MILEALKARTATSHRNVEASPLMQPIANRTLTPENYTQILRKFYGFFQPLENAIHHVAGLEYYLPDLATRRKAASILQDLRAIHQENIVLATLPLCPDVPIISDFNGALGALYVMEGSTLGGKFISKIVYETLGFTPENGIAFFNGYGTQTGPKWKAFQEALRRYTSTSTQEEAIVNSATCTFQKLEVWFNN
ncbi:biliverdin-producing heme oxygenase [Adhaeribacter radiodurans]|uniref:Biliverdin-producing heme oxygenase n=1 Tax=Adhaeribacter radiodurans TaxID=2745197 RepID=A0A7L7L8R5_9BACT|nr:biliverdin-producing heme oxygenase [Adhaeribacter radiodurans]QMU28915.1 biliverdin-producing heme oxygenase [Adhaeribacter radiodurans]